MIEALIQMICAKRESIDRLQSFRFICFALLVSTFLSTQSFAAFWTGEGEDTLWDNPENWSGNKVPVGTSAFVSGTPARGKKGPLIEEGMEASVSVMIGDDGSPKLRMTGGSLDVTGRGIFWGEFGRATFEMSGGVVNLTGNPGMLIMGDQSTVDAPKSSTGILEMTGGEFNVNGLEMPGDGQRGVGEIGLYGGTLNVGSRDLNLYRGAEIDITEGVLTVAGDKRDDIASYIQSKWLKGYDGDAELAVTFAGGRTTVKAIDPNPSIPGDYNENGLLDVIDLDLHASQGIAKQNLDYDTNGDGFVNTTDRVVWTNFLKNTWMGDADLSGEFDSSDLVTVFAFAKYETGALATWRQGDWNGDMRFGSGDLVEAFGNAGYDKGPRPGGPNALTAAVPEPSTFVLLLMSGLVLLRRKRQ